MKRKLMASMVVVLGACGVATDEVMPTAGPVVSEEAAQLSPPIDRNGLDALFRRTRLAFQERDGVLRGGDATSGAEVSTHGIAVTPFRWPVGATILRNGPIDQSGVVKGAPLRLETSRITRASLTLWGGGAARGMRIAHDGSAELDRLAATETVRNVEGGIEQSWRFDSAPPGNGDLVVRVAVSGQSYGDRTHGGLHFVDPTTGLGYSYSDAVWIDATGERHAVPATFSSGEIVLVVPDAVVRESTYPVVLDPTVGGELGYDNPLIGPAVAAQTEPDIGSTCCGGDFVVVWSDARRDTTLTRTVFDANITTLGVITPQVGRAITTQPGDQSSPAIYWGNDGSFQHYVIVFGQSSPTALNEVYYVVTDATGAPLDAPQLVSANARLPDVSFSFFTGGTSSRFAIAWQRTAGGIGVKTYRNANPTQLALTGGPTNASMTGTGIPAIASGRNLGTSSDTFFLVWSDSGASANIVGKTVNATAGLGPLQTISNAVGLQTNPDVAYSEPLFGTDRRGFIVVWEDYRSGIGGSADIWAQYVSPAGSPVPPNFALSTATGHQITPTIAGWNVSSITPIGAHAGWLATWNDARSGTADIYGQLIRSVGVNAVGLEGSNFPISTAGSAQVQPAVYPEMANQRYFAVWSDSRSWDFGTDIYGARVNNNGTVVDPSGLLITQSANQQETPATANCNDRQLTVWTDTRNGSPDGLPPTAGTDIYGALTDSTTGHLLVNNILISTAGSGIPAPGWQKLPDVACIRDVLPSDFFVVWDNAGDVYGARVQASDGKVLDSSGIAIATATGAQTEPAIAYLEQNFLSTSGMYQVVWTDNRSGNADIWGQTVIPATGALFSTAVNISGPAVGAQINPDVTFDINFAQSNNRFLVVWEDLRAVTEFENNRDIWGVFIEVSGALGPPIQITTAPLAAETKPSVATRRAWGGGIDRAHLVVYETNVVFGVDHDLEGRIVTDPVEVWPNPPIPPIVGPPIVLGDAPENSFEPQVALRNGVPGPNDDKMVLTFWYEQAGADPGFDFGVRGQDIDVSPLAVLGPPFSISAVSSVRERTPAVACSLPSTPTCQVPYRRYDDAAGADRVFYRVLTY